jgi:hypothetical protein
VDVQTCVLERKRVYFFRPVRSNMHLARKPPSHLGSPTIQLREHWGSKMDHYTVLGLMRDDPPLARDATVVVDI